MRQVGDLWVWADRASHRLMLGNRAAAVAQSAPPTDSSDGSPFPVAWHPGDFSAFGAYAVTGGPVVRLRLAIDSRLGGGPEALGALLAPLRTDRPADITLDYSAAPEGRALWRDGALVASGPLKGEGVAHGFNFYFELVRVLLSHRPLAAILHGSGLRWRGRNLLFMGVSGSGKSTLAALLATRGARYLGDDLVALLAPDAAVHPLPFSPSIKEGAWPVLSPHFPDLMSASVYHKGDVALRYLPGAPMASGSQTGAPDLLVFPRFTREASPKSVALTPVETLLELSRAGLWLDPEGSETLLDWACACPAIALRHTADLEATERLLTAALPQV